jgi:hypothetical protein
VRKEAEAFIKKVESQSGFCPCLLEIAVDKTVTDSIASSAAVNLARVLSIVWTKVDPEDFNDELINDTGNISPEDKNYFRKHILSKIY